MIQHPRVQIVNAFKMALLDLESDHALTQGEFLAVYASRIASDAKYIIREERHPGEPDRPGDIE